MSEFIVTHVENLPSGKVRVAYLLPGGFRPVVTINQWENNADTQAKIAHALMGVENAVSRERKT